MGSGSDWEIEVGDDSERGSVVDSGLNRGRPRIEVGDQDLTRTQEPSLRLSTSTESSGEG